MLKFLRFSLGCSLLLTASTAPAQSFTKITDPGNPLSTPFPSSGAYIGVSWVDYNGDGLLDLFYNPGFLYRNDGNGDFTQVSFPGPNPGDGNGNAWGDIDNDGDPDVIIAASPSKYYRNDDGIFVETPFTEVTIDTFNFWSAALADYDQDGWLDLFLAHPAGFLPFSSPISRESLLFHNDGDGSFTRAVGVEPDDELAAHTVVSWTDYDLDGDQDLFIGSGEVGFLSLDHLFKNNLTETGTATLTRITTGALAQDLRDGQNWNLIDYDNDRDLDAFVTNYNANKTNDLYRNDNGTYVKMTAAQAGSIANQNGKGLTNLWTDFDNDGYLDCFVSWDSQADRYYHNNGDGTFSEVATPFTGTNGFGRGAAAGDYDNDGFQDLFISVSGGIANMGLYRNNGNDNHWANFTLQGTISNRSAIGARVWAKADLNGNPTWQTREVSSQNSFNGHNSQRVHFGFGATTTIDSLLVLWPNGLEEIYTALPTNQFCTLVEGGGIECTATSTKKPSVTHTFQIYPNPVKAGTLVELTLPPDGDTLRVIDTDGRIIRSISLPANSGNNRLNTAGLAPGTYFLVLEKESTIWRANLVIVD